MEIEEAWRDSRSSDNLQVTVGEWGLTRAIKLALVVNPKNRITAYDKKHGAEYDKLVTNMNGDTKNVYDLFFDFLSEAFSTSSKKNPSIYQLTSAYTNLVLLHSDCDGLMYPSVQYKGESFNIVLKDNAFQSGLVKLNKSVKHSFKKTPMKDGKFEFKELNSIETKKVDNEGNQIVW